MNEMESQASAVPIRPVPPEWRTRIIANARAVESSGDSLLRTFLWPHPAAWLTVIVAWIAILALELTGPKGADLFGFTPPGAKRSLFSLSEYAYYVDLCQRQDRKSDQGNGNRSEVFRDLRKHRPPSGGGPG